MEKTNSKNISKFAAVFQPVGKDLRMEKNWALGDGQVII